MTNPDFSRRSTATELMDTEPTSFEEFDSYLRDLERINVSTLAYRPTLLWLKRAVANFPGGWPISVLDVGSGRGGPRWHVAALEEMGTREEPEPRSDGSRYKPVVYKVGDRVHAARDVHPL